MNRRIRAPAGTPRSAAGFQTLGRWIFRVARLDFTVFEDARAERTGTAGAMQHDDFRGLDPAPVFLKTVIAGGLLQTLVWLLWVYMAHWVLVRLFGAQVVFQELVRCMGVAFTPIFLSLFVGIAPLAVPFGVFSLGLTFLTTNIAIEQATGVTPREATFANLAGFGAFLVFMGALANVAEAGTFGGLAPGLLFFSLDL